jgi:hypothetical protein
MLAAQRILKSAIACSRRANVATVNGWIVVPPAALKALANKSLAGNYKTDVHASSKQSAQGDCR